MHGIELVIIDTPPAFLKATHKDLALADLVIVPAARRSQHHLRLVSEVAFPLQKRPGFAWSRFMDQSSLERRSTRKDVVPCLWRLHAIAEDCCCSPSKTQSVTKGQKNQKQEYPPKHLLSDPNSSCQQA